MRDAFEVLRRDHERILALLAELEELATAPSWRSSRCVTLTERLVIEESRHEVAEEVALWPAVRAKIEEGYELIGIGIPQEQQGKRMLKALESAAVHQAADEDGYLSRLGDARRLLREHIDFEERSVLPPLREALHPELAVELGARLEQARSRAPTRPHPRTLPVPGVLRMAGRLVGPLDRTRDFVHRRGRTI
jgi:hemerythrin-like domain-containing protein